MLILGNNLKAYRPTVVMKMNDLRQTIANNISAYRNDLGLQTAERDSRVNADNTSIVLAKKPLLYHSDALQTAGNFSFS